MKLCLVGCGAHASRVHGPVLKRIASIDGELQLAGCCDLDESRAAAYATQFGFDGSFTDFRIMIDSCMPDALILISPPHLTSRLGCELLAFGIPLLIEKPPGLTLEEVSALAESAGATPHMVAFNRRHAPLVVKLKSLLAELRRQGRPTLLHYDFMRCGRFDTDFSATAIHGIDLARYIVDDEFASLDMRHLHPAGTPDHVRSVLMAGATRGGTQMSLCVSPVAGRTSERITVHGRDYTFHVDLVSAIVAHEGSMIEQYQGDRLVGRWSGLELAGDESVLVQGGFVTQMLTFLAHCRSGRGFTPTVDECRSVVSIMEAMRSGRSHWHS